MKHIITVGNNAEIKITSVGDQMVITIDTPAMTEMTSESQCPSERDLVLREDRLSSFVTQHSIARLSAAGIETIADAVENMAFIRGVDIYPKDKETIERLVERLG